MSEKCEICNGHVTKYRSKPQENYSTATLYYCENSKKWAWFCDNGHYFHTTIQPYTGTMIYCPICGEAT